MSIDTTAGSVRTYSAVVDRDLRGCGGGELESARAEVQAITDENALADGWRRVTAAVVEYQRPAGSRHLHRTTAAYERCGERQPSERFE